MTGRSWASLRHRAAGFAALCALLLPATGVAEELGRITAFLGGKQKSWLTITTTHSGGVIASASLTLGPRLAGFEIQGHPEARLSSREVLSIDVRFRAPLTAAGRPMAVDILYMPDGLAGPFWTSRGAPMPARFEILALEVWGAYARVEAQFDATLCLRPAISAATDPTECQALSGWLETKLAVD